jgi:hypothetical protein
MRQRLEGTPERCAALRAVHEGRVWYDNGLHRPGLGYTWAPGSDAHPMSLYRESLDELRVHGFIQVETHRTFTSKGHQVSLTVTGFRHLHAWESEQAHSSRQHPTTGLVPAQFRHEDRQRSQQENLFRSVVLSTSRPPQRL